MTARSGRPSSRLVRRSRYSVVLIAILAGVGGYILWREGQRGRDTAAESCAAMPPVLARELEGTEDCGLFHRTLTQTLATTEGGAITRWVNNKSGMTGTIKLGATEMRAAVACRRAEVTLVRTGEPKRAEIVACLKDGRWEVREK